MAIPGEIGAQWTLATATGDPPDAGGLLEDLMAFPAMLLVSAIRALRGP
jgi:hypothetical protein